MSWMSVVLSNTWQQSLRVRWLLPRPFLYSHLFCTVKIKSRSYSVMLTTGFVLNRGCCSQWTMLLKLLKLWRGPGTTGPTSHVPSIRMWRSRHPHTALSRPVRYVDPVIRNVRSMVFFVTILTRPIQPYPVRSDMWSLWSETSGVWYFYNRWNTCFVIGFCVYALFWNV
jgi:hypothetical protein